MPPNTRMARAQAIKICFGFLEFLEFLELRHKVEIHNLTGRVVECPIDEVNRPRGRREAKLWIQPSAEQVRTLFAGVTVPDNPTPTSLVGVGPEGELRGRPVTGHDPAATGSGRVLIKPPKQTGPASPPQPVDRSREVHSNRQSDSRVTPVVATTTDPVSQPRAGHPKHLQAIQEAA
ncbi:hypothetical protein [Saccharopolyspora pogona]|uniref:hypothetical protein n=1 Tax=Saccharopolyspora pogona TaxID=333966 RepID=UPI001CC224D8|nr:hypothetical protein [Saccharopolyspora pogona]